MFAVRDGGEMDGCIKFLETQVVSPYAKFEVEAADVCFTSEIAKTTNIGKETNSRTSIGLQQPPPTRRKINPRSHAHCSSLSLQTLLRTPSGSFMSNQDTICVYQGRMIQQLITACMQKAMFMMIKAVMSFNSMIGIPTYVAFKGDNSCYLRLKHDSDHHYLEFKANDIGDPNVPCQIFYLDNGDVRIKLTCLDKFWWRDPNWIRGDSSDTSSNDKSTLFRPVRVDSKTIALMNLGNNYFCKRLTEDNKTSCLNANVPSVTNEAKLTVEEPVMTRNIYDVKYNLDYSRVYDESVLIVAKNSASNNIQEAATLNVKLSYTNTTESTWNDYYSLSLGMQAGVDFKIPLIMDGNIEISEDVESGAEWGVTTTSSNVVETTYTVTVPPMTKVTVNMIATKGYCDVPFTYSKTDTLYNGTTVTSEGGTYTGSNYYNVAHQTEEEGL